MRVGIPRALYSFYHYPLWQSLLAELGHEIVLSPATDRDILNEGIRLSPPETCLPVKSYLGHISWLKTRCDALLLHRLVCVRQGARILYGCPKAMCMPDLVRASIPGLPRVLEVVQDERVCSAKAGYRALAEGRTTRLFESVWKKAVGVQSQVQEALRAGALPDIVWDCHRDSRSCPGKAASSEVLSEDHRGTELRVGVVGHHYLLFDRALSLDLPGRLEQLGARGLYTSARPAGVSFPEPARYQEVHWFYEHDLLAGARHFSRLAQQSNRGVDGILLVSSFACGTAAVVNEIVQRELALPGVPMATIVLDEQTGEAGLATRLEAFTDLVRRQRHRLA